MNRKTPQKPFPVKSGWTLLQSVINTIICLFLWRWQSPSDGYQHSLPPGADAGYSDSGGEGERVRWNGTLYGVSSSPQDPGDALHPGQSRCESLVLLTDLCATVTCRQIRPNQLTTLRLMLKLNWTSLDFTSVCGIFLSAAAEILMWGF